MSEETKELIAGKKIMTRYVWHMLITIGFAIGVAWFSNEIILEHAWGTSYFLCAGLILGVIALCSLLEKQKLYASVRTTGMSLACFIVSALLLFLSDFYVNLPIWLLGGIVAAALINRNIGMMYLYYFVFHAIYLEQNVRNGLVFHLVAATLIAFFIPKMKSFLSMFYMMAFTACVVITGSVIHNRMSISDSMLLDTFYILCTYLGCIFITMLLVKWTGSNNTEQETAKEEVSNNYEYLEILAQETAEQDAAIAAIKQSSPVQETVEADYSSYCDEKSELLLELRAKNKPAYAQALLVGKLASEIAKSIGLNEALTKAAGLYKKIGKIKETNDENTSTEIAKEHKFPDALVSLLDQLNHNRIEQKEAALLLITDGVISYYTIVRHVQKTDISVEKIVDTIVSKKIFQGEFNESGLSMQECFMLREKLIDLLKSQDKKHAAN